MDFPHFINKEPIVTLHGPLAVFLRASASGVMTIATPTPRSSLVIPARPSPVPTDSRRTGRIVWRACCLTLSMIRNSSVSRRGRRL